MIGTSGQPAIDLSRKHFQRPHADLLVIGTWLWNNDQESHEPCLVILPAVRRSGYVPVVIALSACFRYDSPKYLLHACIAFNKALGFEDNAQNVHKLADAIHGHLRDLLTIPPNPTTAVVVADATVSSGGKSKTMEVVEHQSIAQA